MHEHDHDHEGTCTFRRSAAIGAVTALADADGEKGHFFAFSRGSAAECAAIVHLLKARGLVDGQAARRARALLVRIVSMSTKLVQKFLQHP